MSERFRFEAGAEPERYELRAEPAYHFEWDRRDFEKFVGGGLLVLLAWSRSTAQESGRAARREGGRGPREVAAWLHVGEDSRITVFTGKVEVGQNIRTSLAQGVAEELSAPFESIHLVMADTQLTPFDAGTFGSRTTPAMMAQLRKVAATAREALIDLAAKTWNVDRAKLTATDGKIVRADTNESLDFGQLSKGEKLTMAIADDPPTTSPEQWKVAGRAAPKPNGRALVTGQHKFASDIRLRDMWHGKVLRPSAVGATLQSVDMGEAKSMAELVAVHDGEFVGIAAPSELQATRALAAIKAEWQTSKQVSAADLFDHLKNSGGASRGGRGGHRVGSIEDGLAAADTRLKATYTIAYIAHCPLEPRAAVAQWQDDKLTVWTGTQRPFGVRSELSRAFRVPDTNVRVIVPDTGSGYGGKHTGEAAIEAARLARAAGRPVKVVWTREEEFTWAYFRPAGVIEIASGVRRDGTLTAWEFHNYNSGASSIRTLYDVPNQRIEFHSSPSPLKQGSYRALAATANHFARETHMDELAHEIGMDALALRLKNLQEPRLRAVLEAAATAFGWGGTPESGHGCGIAGGFEKGSYVATCAEVSVDAPSGNVKVVRATSAFECGAVVNPDDLKNQIEGALVMGIGGTLWERIDFADGKIRNASFSAYRVPRFSDTPRIEVVLLDRKDLPSEGAGETPIVCIAPAIGSAIHAATGKRLRSLPMTPSSMPA